MIYKAGLHNAKIEYDQWIRLVEVFELEYAGYDNIIGCVKWSNECGDLLVTTWNPMMSITRVVKPIENKTRCQIGNVGIEGRLEFVNNVYEYLVDKTDHKEHEWGSRSYI